MRAIKNINYEPVKQLYSIQYEMRSIREHLKKIGDNSEQTVRFVNTLKK